MIFSADIGVWVAAALTIAVLSGFIKENKAFLFAESIFIGVSAGYFGCVWLLSVVSPAIDEAVNGNILMLVPVIAGLMLFLPQRREKRYSKLIYMPSSFIALIYTAFLLPVYFDKYLFEMISASISPLVVLGSDGEIVWSLTLNSWISIAGTVSVMWFLVSRFYDFGKPSRFVGEVGRFYVLVALGCSFGYTLMSRIVLFSGRFDFILTELLGFRF